MLNKSITRDTFAPQRSNVNAVAIYLYTAIGLKTTLLLTPA